MSYFLAYLEEEDITNLFVDFEANENVAFKMIFSGINSVLRLSVKNGKYDFPDVAKGEWVTIFGMKSTDGQIETFFKKN